MVSISDWDGLVLVKGITFRSYYENSPAVLNGERTPLIAPDADDPEKTVRIIEMWPSVALSYTLPAQTPHRVPGASERGEGVAFRARACVIAAGRDEDRGGRATRRRS